MVTKWTKWLKVYAALTVAVLVLFSYFSFTGKSLMPFNGNTSWFNNNNQSTTNGFHHK